jgi:hypothetical protein
MPIIKVTPLQFDLTHHAMLNEMKNHRWEF